MLVVLDGWGWRVDSADNAVRLAHTLPSIVCGGTCPHALVRASGDDVGLPQGQMGNSEVGHIGAGRVVMQDLSRNSNAIADGEIGKSTNSGSGRCDGWCIAPIGG